jgi:ABC-2 type transport system ATP-binding protein
VAERKRKFEEFLQVLGEQRERGATVFLSSHDLPEVERACDRVGIIRAGRLAAVESVDEMRARAYRKVTLRLRDSADVAEFERIEGVESVERDGDLLTFRALGSLGSFSNLHSMSPAHATRTPVSDT